MSFDKIHTINDLLSFLDTQITREKHEKPSDIAWDITGLLSLDTIEDWCKKYPLLTKILDSSADLEVTEKVGYEDAGILWQRIKTGSIILEAQVNSRFLSEKIGDQTKNFVHIGQVISFWDKKIKKGRNHSPQEVATEMIDIMGNQHFADWYPYGDRLFVEVFDLLIDIVLELNRNDWEEIETLVQLLLKRYVY